MALEFFRYVESPDELGYRQQDRLTILVQIEKRGVIDRVMGFTREALQPADEFPGVFQCFARPVVPPRRFSSGPECGIVGQACAVLDLAGLDTGSSGIQRFHRGRHYYCSTACFAQIVGGNKWRVKSRFHGDEIIDPPQQSVRLAVRE